QNTVGKRAIASPESEMAAGEQKGSDLQIVVLRPGARAPLPAVTVRRSVVRLEFALPTTFANVILDPTVPTQSVRLKPRTFSELLIKNPGGNTVVQCINNPPSQ